MHVPAVAAEQAGAFTRKQAFRAGIAYSTIRRRIREQQWVPVVPEVFVAAGHRPSLLTRAWAGHLVTGGVVAGPTAAALHGFAEDDGSIHVISRRDLHARAAGVTEHRVRLRQDETTAWGRLPITNRRRALIDQLATASRHAATRLLFRAVQQNWLDRAALEEQIRLRSGMTGNVQLRELAEFLGTGAHSVAEHRLHRILLDAGMPFHANVPVHLPGCSRYIVDVLVADRVVIEVDGRAFHSDPVTFESDRRRQNDLVGAGYVVLRFTWIELVERPGAVMRAVLDAVAVSQ